VNAAGQQGQQHGEPADRDPRPPLQPHALDDPRHGRQQRQHQPLRAGHHRTAGVDPPAHAAGFRAAPGVKIAQQPTAQRHGREKDDADDDPAPPRAMPPRQGRGGDVENGQVPRRRRASLARRGQRRRAEDHQPSSLRPPPRRRQGHRGEPQQQLERQRQAGQVNHRLEERQERHGHQRRGDRRRPAPVSPELLQDGPVRRQHTRPGQHVGELVEPVAQVQRPPGDPPRRRDGDRFITKGAGPRREGGGRAVGPGQPEGVVADEPHRQPRGRGRRQGDGDQGQRYAQHPPGQAGGCRGGRRSVCRGRAHRGYCRHGPPSGRLRRRYAQRTRPRLLGSARSSLRGITRTV